MKDDLRKRLTDSVETALALADGLVEVEIVPRDRGRRESELTFSREVRLPRARRLAARARAAHLLVQLAARRLPGCTGLGSQQEIDPELVVPDRRRCRSRRRARAVGGRRDRTTTSRSPRRSPSATASTHRRAVARSCREQQRDLFLNGTGGERIRVTTATGRARRSYMRAFEGIVANLERRYRETDSEPAREKIEEYMSSARARSATARA
jgi:excinuclease ABC subunit A